MNEKSIVKLRSQNVGGRLTRLAIAVFISFAPLVTQADMILARGRSERVTTTPHAVVRVANGSVVRAEVQGANLKITGTKLGSTSVKIEEPKTTSGFLLPDEINVHVVTETVYQNFSILNGALRNRRGLTISFDGQKLLVTGRLLRIEDWLAIADAGRSLPAQSFLFTAEVDDELRERMRDRLGVEMRRAGLPFLESKLDPVLSILVPSEPKDLATRVNAAMARFGAEVILSPTAVSLEPLVRVKILVAEFQKKFMQQLGIQWPSRVGLVPTPDFINKNDLSVDVQALEQNGVAKVLASPTLLCRSGKEASFLAGGEFPIKIVNHKTQEVIWKKHGIMMHIRPVADSSGHMSIAIETEVSMIDDAQKVDGVPGLLTNRIETHFDLARSRTIALSGLIKQEWGRSKSGLPGLASLPILGALFSSEDYRENRTELVIFVTPEIENHDSGEVAL